MNQEQLKSRLKFIKGRELPRVIPPVNATRRGKNHIEMEEEHPSEHFDDFFEYERELSSLKSSSQQFSDTLDDEPEEKVENSSGFIMLEEESQNKIEITSSPISLEEEIVEEVIIEEEQTTEKITLTEEAVIEEVIEEKVVAKEEIIVEKPSQDNVENDEEKRKYDDVVGFEFKYCAYIKRNGKQCRRQAPKEKEHCSIHAKLIARENKG